MLPANFLTATETQALLSTGKVKLDKIVKDHVARYSERDQAVKAWAHYQGENAEAEPEGVLKGVVIGIKDIFNTKDMPTGHGSVIFDGSQPGVDASVVGVCRAKGAVMMGKTHTTAFAASKIGPPTCNPFNPDHTPGGSSSGSAAAVSDYQCHIALGTQTGGSIIRPASFCGIFGFKPTSVPDLCPGTRHGTICRDGVKSFAQTFDTIGFFARSISDIQLISRACKVIDEAYDSGTTTGTSPKAIKDCRFAFLKTDQFESHATDDLKAVWAKARQLLLAAGASVVDLDLPPDFHGFSAEDGLMPKLTAAEGRTNLLYEYLIGKDDLDPELAGFVDDKPVVATRQEVARIEDTLASLRPEIDSIAARYDAIVTPSVPGEAPKGLGWTGDPRFCTPWTGLHVPSINVPGFASSHGLPIGLTLVAPRYDDERLLNIAKLVAEVFIGSDEGKLGKIPAPEAAVHVRP